MPFNIAEFNANIAKTGVGRTNFFEGWIVGGPGQNLGQNSIIRYGSNDSRFRIESLNLPGRNLVTIDQNYHGPVRQLPYRTTYQPCSMTVILSQDFREREMFMRWQDYMIGHYRTGYNRSDYNAMFDSKYYDDSVGTVVIQCYSYEMPSPVSSTARQRAGKPVVDAGEPGFDGQSGAEFQKSTQRKNSYQLQYTIVLEEAYPASVNDIAMSWGDDGYARLQVEMRYRFSVEQHRTFKDQTRVNYDRSSRGS